MVARMIARVDPKNGVTVLEPTCASWTWINRGTSLRSVDPFTNLVVFIVQMGVSKNLVLRVLHLMAPKSQ